MNIFITNDDGINAEGIKILAEEISKIAKEHIKNVTDYVNVGDKVPVKVIEIDDQGRINLTMKDLVENNSEEENKNENSSEENTETSSNEEKIEE